MRLITLQWGGETAWSSEHKHTVVFFRDQHGAVQAGRPELEHTGSKVLFIQSTCLVMAGGETDTLLVPASPCTREHKEAAAAHGEPLSLAFIERISLRFRSVWE